MKLHSILKNIALLIALVIISLSGCRKKPYDETSEGVNLLIDSDMVESFDDGIAFMMLLGTDNIHIMGLTTTTTNVWAQEGLSYGIRIGELCGGNDVTYIAGKGLPLREGRLDSINREIDANPGKDADWRGAVSYPIVEDWESFYHTRYGRQPVIRASSLDASEYIADRVMSNPGKITILAIGACTNIAKALMAHPQMASMAREIVYMGGAVNCPGNTTPYAELNFLYDPEAAAICLRAPFPKQTLVSLDVCNTVIMDKARFMSVYDAIRSEDIRSMIRGNFPFPDFQENPSSIQYIWDLVSAAIVINPHIITEYKDIRIDIDDSPGSPAYGRSFETDDESCQIIRVPSSIDQARFWDILISAISKF